MRYVVRVTRIVICGVALLSGSSEFARAQYVSGAHWKPAAVGLSVDSTPAAIRSTVDALQKFNADQESNESDIFSNEISPKIARSLADLKHQLRDISQRSLDASPAVEPTELRRRIVGQLATAGVSAQGWDTNSAAYGAETNGEAQYESYGRISNIEIEDPEGHDRLRAIKVTLEIECGTDESLYIFEREGARWQLAMAVESDVSGNISSAQSRVNYGISPPDAHGNWFVVATRVDPWCTSNWHEINFRVLRPTGAPYAPAELLTRTNGVYLGADEVQELSVTRDSFHLSFWNWFTMNLDGFTRAYAENYKVFENSVERVPPIATGPSEFVDEWVRLPWGEAAAWTDQKATGASDWHDKLHDPKSAADVAFVQPCPGGVMWLIGFQMEGKSVAKYGIKEFYATVVQRDGAYFLRAMDVKRPEGCPGETPFQPTEGLP